MQYYCAPLEGVTGYVYRRAHCRYFSGVDRYFMPFFSPAQEHVFPRRERQEFLSELGEGLRAVPQLLTRRAEDFVWAAGELSAMGYDEVNLNLGCPSGTVCAKGKGSGFLAFPDELDRFLDDIFSKVRVPVSVKTRLGIRDAEEFAPLLEIYARYPIAELTIHPRVQKDFYKNRVRLDVFASAVESLACPVCYNGDLVTPGDCAEAARRFPQVGALMLGRGLVADPALIRKAKGGKCAGREELRAFHDELYESYAASFGSRRNATLRMKEMWSYLIRLFDGGERHAKALKKSRDTAEYEAAAAAIFRDLPLLDSAAGLRDYALFENM